jgi:hypothetical protein
MPGASATAPFRAGLQDAPRAVVSFYDNGLCAGTTAPIPSLVIEWKLLDRRDDG